MSLASHSDLVDDIVDCNDLKEDIITDTNLTQDHGDIYSNAADLPLYEGLSNSVLHTLVKYFHSFSKHPGIIKEAFSSILAIQSSLLPPGNNLPKSYDIATEP